MFPRYRKWMVMCLGVALLLCAPMLRAQTVVAKGDLDCNGFSKIQQPLKAYLRPAPISSAPRGAGSVATTMATISVTMSRAWASFRPPIIPGTLSSGTSLCPSSVRCRRYSLFETLHNVLLVLALALCDDNSFPNGASIPDSDENTPSQTGAAVLELQLYPPGFVSAISCDDVH